MGKSKRVRILTVVGARPQFIKAAVLSHLIQQSKRKRFSTELEEIIVHTGQHYDRAMSKIFFQEMGIPKPKYNLGVGSGSHGVQTGQMLVALEKVIARERPDMVLIYGDTNSTLAGALAASKLHIPVAHVEAGLRSFNRRMPEEINRIVSDRISDMLFAPTKAAVSNLLREGIEPKKMHLVGDIMYDASLLFFPIARKKSRILAQLGIAPGTYILGTVHRAESTDNPVKLEAILRAFSVLARKRRVIFPVHPRTKAVLDGNRKLKVLAQGVDLIDPVGYLDMQQLEHNAILIATDSGGVQKEAYFHRVPCVTLRTETEWVELIRMGWNRLASPHDSATILKTINAALAEKRPAWRPLYGKGDCGEKILHAIIRRFG